MLTAHQYDIEAYIAELSYVPTNVSDLASIIKFNEDHPDIELPAPWHTSQTESVRSLDDRTLIN